MYKITFELDSAICFSELPLFDGILAYCYVKDKLGFVPRSLNYNQDEMEKFFKEMQFDKIPLRLHEDGYFLASYMQYNKSSEESFSGSWKKRWANKHDKFADFGKSKRVIEIGKGKFKSYDTLLNLHAIDKVWFYFDSDNISEVERLLSKHLYGLGKKTSQGYGKIKSMILEQIDYNPFEKVIRPVPIPKDITDQEKTKLLLDGRVQLCRIFPPYWSNVRSEVCLVR